MLASNLLLLALFFASSVSAAKDRRAEVSEAQVSCFEGCKPVSNTFVLEKNKRNENDLIDKDFECLAKCVSEYKPTDEQRESTKSAIAKCKIMNNGFECYVIAIQLYYMVDRKTFNKEAADISMTVHQKRLQDPKSHEESKKPGEAEKSKISTKTEEPKNIGETKDSTTVASDGKVEPANVDVKEEGATSGSAVQVDNHGTTTKPFALVGAMTGSFIAPYIYTQLC